VYIWTHKQLDTNSKVRERGSQQIFSPHTHFLTDNSCLLPILIVIATLTKRRMAKASGRRRSSSLTPCQHQEDVEEGGEEGSFLSENSGHHHNNLMSGYSGESPVMDGPERSPTSILLPLGTITNTGNMSSSAPVTEGRQSSCSMKDRTNSITTISEIDGKIHPVQGMDTVCISCRQMISDRYIMRMGETSWHESCLICCLCQIQLTRTCYSREGKLYCRADYDKLFAAKCSACLGPIPSTDLVMRVLDNVYHLSCFSCLSCGRLLEKGDQFVVRGGGRQLCCRPDFEKEMSSMSSMSLRCPDYLNSQRSESAVVPSTHHQNSPVSSSVPTNISTNLNSANLSSCGSVSGRLTPPTTPQTTTSGGHSTPLGSSSSAISPGQGGGNQAGQGHPPTVRQDGRRGPKRPRTILTTAQRRAFKASFETSPKPCRKVREHLAKETGLSVRIVQVWFQNQRAKLKKIQRKQQQLQQQQSQSSSLGDSTSEKGEKIYARLGINTSSGHQSGHLTDSSLDSPSNSFSTPLGGGISYLTHSPEDPYYSPHDPERGFGTKGGGRGDMTAIDSESSLTGLDDVLMGGHPHHQGGQRESMPSLQSMDGDQPHLNHQSLHHHQQHHPGLGSNPIDKLYSMQSSYFNSSDCECIGSN